MSQQTSGAALIAMERERQKRKGYNLAHDANHTDGSMLIAALLIVCDRAGHDLANCDPPDIDGPWPDALLLHMREKYADDEIRQLTIAGAMIAAEIDRLQAR